MQAPASVCPGYKHVEAFSNEDDYYESEEEVSYITLDLGDVEPQLVPSATTYRLIGLDTPTPYLQLQGTVMKGRHDLLLGTELIFTDDKDTTTTANHDWNKRSLVHVANTEQRIAFQEVTLIPKHKVSPTADLPEADGDTSVAGAAATITTSDFLPPQTENNAPEIDKLTGVTAPPIRAPRKKKEQAAAAISKKRSGKKTPKGKGKEKEAVPSLETDLPMNEDGIGEDDLDDIYVDYD